jgi:mono/diheme cytochrome c family protein
MRWTIGCLSVVVAGGVVLAAEAPRGADRERGRQTLLTNPLNPPNWTVRAYDTAWTQWGVKARPADYDRAFRERYGLHRSPDPKQKYPLGLVESNGFLSKGLVQSCLMCHAGTVAGQTVMGLGNTSLDLQALFDELGAADGARFRFPFQFSSARGTIDPLGGLSWLLAFRDADLNLQKHIELDYFTDVCSRPPAWWQLKKKRTRDWTGGLDARSMRVDMANLLTPFNSPAYIKQQVPVFADIHAFVLGTRPPAYPFPIDRKRAARGERVFAETCAKCHGTYGARWTYPNKIVPLRKLGTDPVLARAASGRNIDYFNKSWFAHEPDPDGRPMDVSATPGYQAPPLDGVWATGPYFHNASVPTVYHVLNSKARPRVFTRSYHAGKENYDPVKLGWKVTVLKEPPGPGTSAFERRKVYDTTQRGHSNAGHTFGDDLTEEERMAVIEYLKTL